MLATQNNPLVGLLLVTRALLTSTAEASSPDAIKKHQQEVLNRCLKASGLKDPKPVGTIIIFGNDVGYDALMVRGNYPQSHMNNQMGQSLCLFNRRTRQAYVSDASQRNRYTSNRSGVQFNYPTGFLVESKSSSGTGDDRSLEWIDLWTQRDYDGIKSNRTPSELPPNVSVSVQQNPRRLALKEWVMQNNQFASPQRFRPVKVAGTNAIAFQSTGLYEYENVALTKPNSSDVIVIRLDKVGMPENDAVYRPAFQQILASLQFSQ
ncbi:MAG: hypothetical protein HC866_26055 [Leptolyngbyaceae cyanobacterium RU_5_1]|nr:hypothetical protein [Leptolyngbyaceae cyanobacterium RU_5_1]